MRPRRAVVVLVQAAACALLTRSSHAQSPDRDVAAHADALSQQGDDAMLDGRPVDALRLYNEAQSLAPHPTLLYNKGRAFEAMGRYIEALSEFEAFDKQAPSELLHQVPNFDQLLVSVSSHVATVQVIASEDDAEILVRERVVGRTPLGAPVRVEPGAAAVEVRKEGFFPYKRRWDLPGGGVSKIDVRLVSRATDAILVVQSPVLGAEVAIDGKSAGVVPAEIALLPGSHEVSVGHEGYVAVRQSFLVRAGESRTISVPLSPTKSVLASWWLWAGVGVVIAGGTVTAIALTSERSIPPGSLPNIPTRLFSF